MRKSLYISDEDKEILAQAQILSESDSLSGTIAEALKEYVDHMTDQDKLELKIRKQLQYMDWLREEYNETERKVEKLQKELEEKENKDIQRLTNTGEKMPNELLKETSNS